MTSLSLRRQGIGRRSHLDVLSSLRTAAWEALVRELFHLVRLERWDFIRVDTCRAFASNRHLKVWFT